MRDFEILEENLRATLSVFTRARESGEARELPGVVLACSGVRFATFNATLLTAPVASALDLKRRIESAAVYFEARGLSWSVWLCEDWLEDAVRRKAPAIIAEQGLHLVTAIPGMTAEHILPPQRPLPAVECRRVNDEATRFAFDHIMSAAFDIPFTISRQIYGSANTWAGELRGYVGFVGGNPVTTAATLATGGAVGLYAVGTLPVCQKRGYGEAIVRCALAEACAASGIERCVLESTRAGLRLYRRLGYKAVTRYSVYASNWRG